MRGVFKAAWSGRAERSRAGARSGSRVLTPASVTWKTSAGPFFGNHLGALTFHGRDATFELHHPVKSDAGPVTELIPEARRDLGASPAAGGGRRMTLLSGIVAVMNRLLGDVATATVGWAIALLYGRVPRAKQSTLSLVALGSLVWIIALLAVILPTLGGMLISSVPRPGFVPIDWLRLALVIVAVGLPPIIGLSMRIAFAPDGRPSLGGVARGDGPWLPAHGRPRRRHPLPRGGRPDAPGPRGCGTAWRTSTSP